MARLAVCAAALAALLVAVVHASNCTAADLTAWYASEYANAFVILQTCGTDSLGLRDEAYACLTQPGVSILTPGCLNCHADLIVCTKQYCVKDCIQGGQTNPTCVTCVSNYGCDGAFVNCTGGFPFPTCDACKTPSSSSGFIPGLSQGGSIGVIVGPLVGLGALCGVAWWLGWFSDKKQNAMLGAHVGHAGSSSNSLMVPGATATSSGSGGSGPSNRYMAGKKDYSQQVNSEAYQAQFSPGGKVDKKRNPFAPNSSSTSSPPPGNSYTSAPGNSYGPGYSQQQAYAAYAQPAYGQPAYGQPAYGQPAYGQPVYGQEPIYNAAVYDPHQQQQQQPRHNESTAFKAGLIPIGTAQAMARAASAHVMQAPSPGGSMEKPAGSGGNKGGAIMDDV